MTRPMRAALLVLALLLQGLGNAWALPPDIQAGQEQVDMPCHGEADTQDSMPCCDDDGGGCCSAACLGIGGALAPLLASLEEAPESTLRVTAESRVPLPAHPLLPLRPPAIS